MIKRISFGSLMQCCILAVLLSAGASEAMAFDASANPTFADLADRLRDTVVTVAAAVIDKRHVVTKRKRAGAFDGEKTQADDIPDSFDDFMPKLPRQKPGEPLRQVSSVGSGFVIDPSGLIVTNNHVIEGGSEVYVLFSDGTELKVDKILGRDLKTDITLLKVTPKPGKPLKAATFGNSTDMRVGDWVLAIGNPFGLSGTVTTGILSGTGRDINAGPYDEFLQTDAAINRGNSGGPLFNAKGEVIGINTAIFSPTGGSIGLGFAIPSNTAHRVVEQLQRYGETRWGFIGVRIQSVSDDLAGDLGLQRAEGALIARVDHGGPAEQAGLEEGDVILSFGGLRIRHSRQLPRVVAQMPVGDEVQAEILRAGQRKMLKVKIARLEDKAKPPAQTIRPKRQRLGRVQPQSLSDDAGQNLVVGEAADGVVVKGEMKPATENSPQPTGKPAEGVVIEPGSVILEVAHQKIRTTGEFQARIEELRQASRREALLTVARPDGEMRFATIDIGDE